MDQIGQALVDVALWGVDTFGRPVMVGLFAMLSAWGLCERFTPQSWPKVKNQAFTLAAGVAMTFLVHAGIPAASLGTGWRGAVQALVVGLAGGGISPLFHEHIVNPYMGFLKRRAGGG